MNPVAPTASSVIAQLRQIIKDYNYWGQSESDAPLRVRRTKSITDAQILSADASMRRKVGGEGYVVPSGRVIREETLLDVFDPLVQQARVEIQEMNGEIEDLRTPVEALEYYVQLYSAFLPLPDKKVCYVDADNDPYVGLFIIGYIGTECVVAQALLVQT